MTMTLAEAKDKLDTLRYRADVIFREAGPELDFSKVQAIGGSTEEKIKGWQAIQLEMTEVGAEYDRLKRIETEMKAAVGEYHFDRTPVNSPPFFGGERDLVPHAPNLKKMLMDSPEFKTLRERGTGTAKLEIPEYKTLIQLSTISPANDRRGIVNMRLEERTVIDMVGESQANSATIEWYEETTVTNAAAPTTEGSAKPEAALAWTLRTTPITTVAVWIPVTVQALQDNDFLESEIRNRLVFMVQRTEEAQVLNGTGSAPAIRGILQTSGIQTQALGGDPVPTAIFKAMGKIRGSGGSGFLEPDGIVMHPNDVVEFMTLQTTDGAYLMQAILQQTPDIRLWGMPIRQTTGITEGTALVGAFAQSAEVYRRGGLSVAASTEHSTYFTENKVAIRAESRIGLAVMIPTGFCTVTGI